MMSARSPSSWSTEMRNRSAISDLRAPRCVASHGIIASTRSSCGGASVRLIAPAPAPGPAVRAARAPLVEVEVGTSASTPRSRGLPGVERGDDRVTGRRGLEDLYVVEEPEHEVDDGPELDRADRDARGAVGVVVHLSLGA